jgi:hypothetical protein
MTFLVALFSAALLAQSPGHMKHEQTPSKGSPRNDAAAKQEAVSPTAISYENSPQYEADRPKESHPWREPQTYINLGLFAVAGLTAFAAFLQARRLRETIDQMKESEERQLRAYLTCFANIRFAGNDPEDVVLTIKNAGRTPAYCVNVIPSSKILKEESGRFDPVPRPIQAAETVIGPGGEVVVERPIGNKTRDAWKSIMNSEQMFFVHGTIFFVDAFEKNRTVEFCFKADIGGTVRLVATQYGNSQDGKRCPPPAA